MGGLNKYLYCFWGLPHYNYNNYSIMGHKPYSKYEGPYIRALEVSAGTEGVFGDFRVRETQSLEARATSSFQC